MMNEMNAGKIEFEVFFRKIQQCADFDDEVLVSFLGITFDDLTSRNSIKKGDRSTITKVNFSGYLNLPLIVSNRLFEMFNTQNSKYLNKDDFVNGMYKLYFSSFSNLMHSTYGIFEFDSNEQINKEDVRLILSHLNFSAEYPIKSLDLDEFITKFFKQRKGLTEPEYMNIIKNENSDLFMIILILLYSKQPFSEEVIQYYRDNCFKSDLSLVALTVSVNSPMPKSNKATSIYRPSDRVIIYMKYEGRVSLGAKRKFSSKNILKFGESLNSCEGINNKCEDNFNDRSINLCQTQMQTLTSSETLFWLHLDPVTFSIEVLKFNSENRLKNNKIVLVDQYLFSFKYSSKQKLFRFERLLPLSGCYISAIEPMKMINTESECYPIVFLNQYGNTVANLSNLFFLKTKEDSERITTILKKTTSSRDINHFYKMNYLIGKGHFGKVKLGEDLKTGKRVAIKVLYKGNMEEKDIENVRNEIDIMNYLKVNRHSNVVKTYDVFEDKDQIYIVMEFLAGGSLSKRLEKMGRMLNEDEVKSVASQIGKALEFFKTNGIVHRDIKTDNIMLMSKDLTCVKIIDFGVSKIMSATEKAFESCGSLLYSAPEILTRTAYNYKIDLWSFGVLIYYLLTGIFPFDGDDISLHEIARRICKQTLFFPEKTCISEELKLVVKSCLEKTGKNREDISELVNRRLL